MPLRTWPKPTASNQKEGQRKTPALTFAPRLGKVQGDANAYSKLLSDDGFSGYLKFDTYSHKFHLLSDVIFCTCLVILLREFRAQV